MLIGILIVVLIVLAVRQASRRTGGRFRCPNCGRSFDDDVTVCPTCGRRIDGQAI